MPKIPQETLLARFSRIETVHDMAAEFRDEENCRRIIEDMVWPTGRFCRIAAR
jgi:hypothetical protein